LRPTSRRGSTDCPWGRFHKLVIIALGVTWILDGLEVTLAGSVVGALKNSPVLQFTSTEIGPCEQRLSRRRGARGAVLRLAHGPARAQEALLHHPVRLPHRHRRDGVLVERVELLRLPLLHRSGHRRRVHGHQLDHQELIPARVRGWTDLVINGSFWIGAALGAVGSIVLLDPRVIDPEYGWRLAFFIGRPWVSSSSSCVSGFPRARAG
jgi:hypothetical protein